MNRTRLRVLAVMVVVGLCTGVARPALASEDAQAGVQAVKTSSARDQLSARVAQSGLSSEDRKVVEEKISGFVRNFSRMVLLGSGDRTDFDRNFDLRLAPTLVNFGLDAESIRPLLLVASEDAMKAGLEPAPINNEREK